MHVQELFWQGSQKVFGTDRGPLWPPVQIYEGVRTPCPLLWIRHRWYVEWCLINTQDTKVVGMWKRILRSACICAYAAVVVVAQWMATGLSGRAGWTARSHVDKARRGAIVSATAPLAEATHVQAMPKSTDNATLDHAQVCWCHALDVCDPGASVSAVGFQRFRNLVGSVKILLTVVEVTCHSRCYKIG